MINTTLLGIIFDAISFVEAELTAKTGAEKKQAAKDIIEKEIAKVPVLSSVPKAVDDTVIDTVIDSAVGFASKFQKKA